MSPSPLNLLSGMVVAPTLGTPSGLPARCPAVDQKHVHVPSRSASHSLIAQHGGYELSGGPRSALSRCAHAAAGLLTSGQLAPAVDFVVRHPEALISLLSLSLSATIGAPWRSCAGLTAAPHPASARRAKHTHARVALT